MSFCGDFEMMIQEFIDLANKKFDQEGNNVKEKQVLPEWTYSFRILSNEVQIVSRYVNTSA